MNTRKLVSLFAILLATVLPATSSWAGSEYGYGDDGYQYSHQQLLASSYRLSEEADSFRRYARKYSYSREVRQAGRAMQTAADDLYYQLKHGGSEYQVQRAYRQARHTYYALRDCYYGNSHALNQLGYVVHDVERDYQRYQRQLASYSRGGYGKGHDGRYRGHGSRVGIGYRSGTHGSGLSLHFRVK